MSNELIKTRYTDANREEILVYLQAGGTENEEGLLLTEKQQKLLIRWQFAAAKIREQKYRREQIARFIINEFKVGRDTAYRDIVNAEYIFSCSYPKNKNFLIQTRIEFIIQKINIAYQNNDFLSAS